MMCNRTFKREPLLQPNYWNLAEIIFSSSGSNDLSYLLPQFCNSKALVIWTYMIFRIKDRYKVLAVFKPWEWLFLAGANSYAPVNQLSRAYQGGSDILAIFMPNSLPRGKRLMSNTPSLGVHFVWFWMIYNASQSFFLIGLIISHTLFRGVSPQIKCLLKLFSPTRTKAVGLNKVQNLPHFLFSGQKSMWGSQETCS